ncbi:LuxR family transcriptional regulator [Corynebacterium hylobatis]|uniref:LuxR family transcriptional regulator n=1 Tax=Corynebacterium hylobatis TaxID=1859290 RepID=A0A430HW81_9CORY|nr:LuxR C-terminal-related transcriptional regulator [Corynebacterium hylobatis]RSZ61596.1 LuxR family transcriptional regulator [Corynebacterium hylobatis]
MNTRTGTLRQGPLRPQTAVTNFVGRERKLAEARNLLVESRLVTMIGPGGVGKTRLATELAERTGQVFADGVWLAGLDSLQSGERVASIVADALQIPDQSNRTASERVTSYVADKELLLVLDNCEHVLEAAAELVVAMLATGPRVRVLATSREPLGIAGEQICVVPPLSTPPLNDGNSSAVQDIEQFESVAMLVERARQVVPDLAVTDSNRDAIAQLCVQLDGIPLAIELAATRLRTLSPRQLLQRLDRRFQLLTRGDRTSLPRQQTLQALISWSFDLCTSAEQLLWRRLSIFPGAFDLDAAEEVCGFGELSPDEIFDFLDQLVSKSIVLAEHDSDQVNYRMLMTIREYGAQLPTDEDELMLLRSRHRDVYLKRVVARAEEWCGSGQAEALAATRRERPNLMVAMDWSLTTPGGHDAAAQMGSKLRYHWVSGKYLSDGRQTMERILRQGELSRRERGTASWAISWVCLIQGDHDAAAEHLEVARGIAEELGDPVMLGHYQHWKALHHLFIGELPTAIELYRTAVASHEAADRVAEQLLAMFQLVMALAFNGEAETGLAVARQARELAERYDERWNLSFIWWITGVCHWHLGDYAAAKQCALQALEIQRDFHDLICTAMSIEVLCWTAVSTGEYERGWKLAEAADSVWRNMGTSLLAFGPHIAKVTQDTVAACRDALKLPAGQMPKLPDSLTVSEAFAVALDSSSSPRGKVVRTEDGPLTTRELEVAEFVARGLTNREIAQELVLSRRTVDGHVERILAKLSFSSRTQVATWIVGQRVTEEKRTRGRGGSRAETKIPLQG